MRSFFSRLSAFLVVLLVGAQLACQPSAPPPAPNRPAAGMFAATAVGGRLKDVVSGVPEPGGRSLTEVRDTFSPDESVMLHGYWEPSGAEVDALWDWIAPNGEKVYQSRLAVRSDWKNTWVGYKGPRPMAAGDWVVRARDGDKELGLYAFTVVRDASELPVARQSLAFETSRLTRAEGDALILALRLFMQGELDAAGVVATLPAEVQGRGLQVAINAWGEGGAVARALGQGADLAASLRDALSRLDPAAAGAPPHTLELTVLHSAVRIPAREKQVGERLEGNAGFSLAVGAASATLFPSAIYRANLKDGLEILRQLSADAGLAESAWEQDDAALHTFRTQEWVLPAGASSPSPVEASRAVVLPEQIDLARLNRGVDDAIGWYLRNQKPSGLFQYSYFPGKDLEPKDDWCLRQLNTIWVLAQFAAERGRPDLRLSVEKAAQVYLDSLNVQGDRAYVDWKTPRVDAGLGSTAFLLATLSELDRPGDAEIRRKLANALLAEQDATGRFSTDFKSADRDVDQQFYPGEAMVALMRYYEVTQDARAKDAVAKAFDYYLAYWERQKDGPFVPWQVRAYSALYRQDPQDRYRLYVFEMADWMLDEMPPVPASRGWSLAGSLDRMPASTGVYLEGMVHAYLLARDTGDAARAARYGAAVAGGLRYILGLQYKAEDVFAYKQPGKVLGGLPTKPLEQEMRLDFTYHGIDAVHVAATRIPEAEWQGLIRAAFPESFGPQGSTVDL